MAEKYISKFLRIPSKIRDKLVSTQKVAELFNHVVSLAIVISLVLRLVYLQWNVSAWFNYLVVSVLYAFRRNYSLAFGSGWRYQVKCCVPRLPAFRTSCVI